MLRLSWRGHAGPTHIDPSGSRHLPSRADWHGRKAVGHRTVAPAVGLTCYAWSIILVISTAVLSVAHAEVVPDRVAEVVAKVSSAVVRVITVRASQLAGDDGAPARPSGSGQPTTSIGSGFIIDPSGFIATNKHVIQDASAVFVVTADSVRYQPTIVGMTANADMALLKIDAPVKLPFVSFGDSDQIRVGDTVIAIGSPFGFDNSVTAGIISATNRDMMESPFDDYFQTDAPTNHGNSGGPLFNLAGEVIGMNSLIVAPTTGWSGLGFALPSNDLHFVFGRLMKTGEVRAGMLPIFTQQVSWMLQQALATPNQQGALVTAVNDKGGAMLHGEIAAGDVILTFNGQDVLDPRDLARKAARATIGSWAELGLYRGGEHKIVHVMIHQLPEAKPIILNGNGQKGLGLELTIGHREDGGAAVKVNAVDPAGTAAASGIQKDDLILEIQQTVLSDPNDALRLFSERTATQHGFTAVLIERDKKRIWIPVPMPN